MIFAEVLGRSGRLASSWAYMLRPCSRMHAAFRTSCNLSELLPIQSRCAQHNGICGWCSAEQLESQQPARDPANQVCCLSSAHYLVRPHTEPRAASSPARLSGVAVSRLARLSWQKRVLRQGPGRARGRETRDVPDQATAGH